MNEKNDFYNMAERMYNVMARDPVNRLKLDGSHLSSYSLGSGTHLTNSSGPVLSSRDGTCNLKNGLSTDTPGNSVGNGHIKFTNKLADCEDFEHNSGIENRIK